LIQAEKEINILEMQFAEIQNKYKIELERSQILDKEKRVIQEEKLKIVETY
jgi:hypothetical protein